MGRKSKYDNSAGPWLRSCKVEIIKPIEGTVLGTIPSWLNGVLIRNGPGLFHIGDSNINHLFDGMAVLHRFEIKDGNVTYKCRFLQSESYKKNTTANRIVVTDFGTVSVPDPCQTIFQRISSAFTFKQDVSDNANISVYPFEDEVYAFAETAVMYKVDKETLETGTKINFRKNFGIVTHTAHPHVTADGTVYNLALSFKKGPRYTIVCFPSTASSRNNDYSMFDKANIVAEISARWSMNPSYMHSWGITKNYFIIIEQPLSIEVPKAIIKQFINFPVRGILQWYDNKMTQFNIINRHTGKLKYKFISEAFCFFHVINSYEYCDHIVLDICNYRDSSILNAAYVDAIKNAPDNSNYGDILRAVPTRFILPLVEPLDSVDPTKNLIQIPTSKAEAYWNSNGCVFVIPEKLTDITCELPTIHYTKFSGKKYQYFYGISADKGFKNPASIVKVDADNKTFTVWSEKDCYPSEAIFVPAPNALNEDDGVVLSSLVWAGDTNRADLLILDAKTFVEIGRVIFQTPTPVPHTFHGWYFPTQKI